MKSSYLAALLGFGASTVLAAEKQCQGQICYTLSIPDATVSSGDGDIYMQITGPSSFSWIGMGQGRSMTGAQMFIVYANANGNNVTLSPRLGTGHVMPRYNSDAQVTLLAGSGISNGVMTANIRCSSCKTWNGGSMDLTSSNTGWIYAANSGSSLSTDSTSATIRQHQDTYGTMSFSSSARGGSSSNPFLAASSTTSSSGGGSAVSSAGSGTSASLAPTSTTSIRPQAATGPSGQLMSSETMLVAHGVLASLAFLILFPLSAMVIRLLSFKGLVVLHSALNTLALIIFIAAFVLGVIIARDLELLGEYHPIIGILLLALLLIQPILGLIHHKNYKRTSSRSIVSYIHIWLGRIIITLGIINGGLGLMLADNTMSGKIAYGVVAGVVYLAYLVVIFLGERKRKNNVGNGVNGGKKFESTSHSERDSPVV